MDAFSVGLELPQDTVGEQSLVVSLHDVSPHTWTPCVEILDELRALGLRHVSLLVVPDHHHRGHFLQHEEFCRWLRTQVAIGHEAVIHGYYHERAPRKGESLRERVITRRYTAGEGEFFDISHDAAKELVSRAQADFEQAGLKPTGFIAPAWLLSAEGERALRELGLIYTTRLRGVMDLASGDVHPSQSLCWSVRAAWRRMISLAWNAFLFHRLETNALLRIAIHPVDVGHPRVWRQIKRLVAAALRTRRGETYESWMGVK